MTRPKPLPLFSDHDIVAARGSKEEVDPRRPYAFLLEREYIAPGRIEEVATVLLTNRECPFRCLMCDLWKHTTDAPVAVGDIPRQLDFALESLSAAQHVKLYNSGSFFDRKAIPAEDYGAIAERIGHFQTVVVENHPKLCGDNVLKFRDLLHGNLEVALGLETVHPDVLPRLNKQMTLDDFEDAVTFLRKNDINVRAFILLRPPFLDEYEGVKWALRSLKYAFDAGVQCCSVIPTRAGNGIMDHLERSGDFAPPSLRSIESVLEAGIELGRGRVFMDLWDLEKFSDCSACGPLRRTRLRQMNLVQRTLPPAACHCGT